LVAGLVAAAVAAGLSAVSPAAKAAGAPVLVAARDLPAGAVVAAHDVAVELVPPATVPDGALRRRAEAVGRMLAGPVRRGEPLTDARLAGPGLLTGLAGTGVSTADRVGVPVRPGPSTARGGDGKAALASGTATGGGSALDAAGDARAGPTDVFRSGSPGVIADGMPAGSRGGAPGAAVAGAAGADGSWTTGGVPGWAGSAGAPVGDVVAVPVRLTDAGAASVVAAGDRIDILATPPQGNGPAVIVASDVLVLANLSGGADPAATSGGLVSSSATDAIADPGDGGLIVVATDTEVAADLARAAVGDQLSPVLRAPPRARAP
jgi:Flp pilus assembly protein CpaB